MAGLFGAKLLSELILAYYIDAYMRQSASMSKSIVH